MPCLGQSGFAGSVQRQVAPVEERRQGAFEVGAADLSQLVRSDQVDLVVELVFLAEEIRQPFGELRQSREHALDELALLTRRLSGGQSVGAHSLL